jgi:NAD(P)-dependent dehydrogenase (short-subunit alcohol dehydrogenase family)
VNAIHPGLMETEMNRADTKLLTADNQPVRGALPIGRVGQPRDIGDAAVFLASDLASYVNATSLVVDGGRLGV